MQAYTHFMTGTLIQKALQRTLKRKAHRIPFMIFLGILSHVVIDDFARMTYHPANAKPGDPFWVGYHLCALVGTIAIVIKWRKYLWGMLCSVIPDVDWFVVRPLDSLVPWAWWEPGMCHTFFRSIPICKQVDSLLSFIPNWTEVPAACIFELILAAGLLTLLLRQTRRSSH